MAYRKITEEELQQWITQHPGGSFRVNGQEYKAPEKQPGVIENLLTTLSKPFRAVPGSVYSAITGKETGNPFLTTEEEQALYENPELFGVKNAAGLGAYLLPVGAAKGVTGLKAVGQAAGRGIAPGALGGFAYSDTGEELSGALKGAGLGALMGGALQGVGEISRGIKAKSIKTPPNDLNITLDSIDDVTKVSKLPTKAKNALKQLSESAGFKDPSLSDSKNILNYLNNRRLAGVTPGQTLENMTQEFANASKLKGEGLKEIGGLSKGYIENIKNQIDDSIKYSGLGATETNALERMKRVLDNAPRDAKTLDSIAQDWYNMGLTRAGEQKMSQAGLYKNGAKAIRDALKAANAGGNYEQAMNRLSRVLGLEDEGAVAAAAATAERSGFNVPMFQNAGFYGTDIKTPTIANTISKARAGIAQNQLTKALETQAPIQLTQAEIPQLLQTLISAGQKTIPATAGAMGSNRQANIPVQQAVGVPTQQPQMAEAQALKTMLAQEVLNGNISATEANAVVSLLGLDAGGVGNLTESQRDYQLAAESMQDAYTVLEQSGGAGKLATLGGNIAGFFGSTTPSSEYRAALDTATAFLRKALIGSGQSEAELKNLNLPKPTDEPEVAKQKILTLIPLLKARAGLQQY